METSCGKVLKKRFASTKKLFWSSVGKVVKSLAWNLILVDFIKISTVPRTMKGIVMALWKNPPKAKVYEALSAVADGRVIMDDGDRAAVLSSNREKSYRVEWTEGFAAASSTTMLLSGRDMWAIP